MQLFRLMLASALAVGSLASAHADSSQTIRQGAQAVVPKQLSDVIGERELMKKYLKEVEKRSDLESKNELEKIALQREIFRSYDQRWWDTQSSDDYWQTYRKGSEYASRIMEQAAGNNGCKLLNGVITAQGLPQPSSDSDNGAGSPDAFKRGIVAAYPSCFVADSIDRLKELDQAVGAIKTQLFGLEEKIKLYRPDEAELLALSQKIQADFVAAMNTLADSEIPRLQEAVNLDAAQLASVQQLAGIISAHIDCAHLVSRRGRTQSCAIPVIAAPYPVSRDAAFKVLFLGQGPGIYQQDLSMDSFFEAVNTFLTEVRPDDVTVHGLFSQVQTVLKKMDQMRTDRLTEARSAFVAAKSQAMLALSLSNRNHWRDYFPADTQKQIIEAFETIKERIETYIRLELSDVQEARILGSIRQNYGRALDEASSMEMKLPLPDRPIFIELGDQEHSRISYDGRPVELPGGYLLGLTSDEVSYWSDYLRIEE